MKNKILLSIVAITLSIFNISCGEDLQPAKTSATFESNLPGDSEDANPAKDTDNIYVALTNQSFLSYINSSNLWNNECRINKSTSGQSNIDCTIDILELDLYMNDLELEYNFPPGMCEYSLTEVPWHWNFSSGVGPTEVTISINTAGSIPTLGTTDPSGSGCTVKTHDGTEVACNAAAEINGLDDQFNPNCAYDYTGGENNPPNCCFGDYTLITHTDLDGDGTVDNISSESTNWGGEPASCIGGHGRVNWSETNPEGYPVGLILNSVSGISNTVSVPANAGGAKSIVSYPATFYETAGSPHSHSGYVSTATSTAPYAVDPIDDLDGSPLTSGNPSYIFRCLDSAFETIHQVNVHVREWNTFSDFINYGNSDGTLVNSDTTGVEGTDCDYGSGFGLGQCNDYLDFKDILNSIGGTYTTDNTVANPNNNRRTYFPEVIY